MAQDGEVEQKVNDLQRDIFAKYNPDGKIVDDNGKPVIKKEHLREFIEDIMKDAQEYDAWDEDDFDKGYHQIDKDRNGEIDATEFILFIKRFADL